MALNRKFGMNHVVHLLAAAAATAIFAGCAEVPQQQGSIRNELVYAVTASNQLIHFNTGHPGKILSLRPLVGLQNNETLLGIDYRVAKGWLYGLGSSGRLYRVDTGNGAVTMIGSGPLAIMPADLEVGFDFNPTVDRIRVVGGKGENMRLHPDTGAVVDGNPNTVGLQADSTLAFAAGDMHAGRAPSIVAAGYTYNKQNEKITTNFAIDAAHGLLVTQGSREGIVPLISPNSGQLYTVGALGIGPIENVSFDISDVSGTAFVTASKPGTATSMWYEINLTTGKATLIGAIGMKERIIGMAIEP